MIFVRLALGKDEFEADIDEHDDGYDGADRNGDIDEVGQKCVMLDELRGLQMALEFDEQGTADAATAAIGEA